MVLTIGIQVAYGPQKGMRETGSHVAVQPAGKPFAVWAGEIFFAKRLALEGWETARPLFDNGVDLIAYKDGRYIPVQLKVSSAGDNRFGLEFALLDNLPRPQTILV
jgi:hypothetical protein